MTKRNIRITLAVSIATLFSGMVIVQPALAAECGGAQTSIIDCKDEKGGKIKGEDAIFKVLSTIIKIMTGLIGLVAVGAVVYGAILYGSSGDSPENVKKAKDIWTNVVIGLVAFAFMVALLNFIIPGGAWQ